MFVSFIANADGVRPIRFAHLMISGFRWCNFPNGSLQ